MDVHLVGSIPLPDSETVFKTVASGVGPYLKRLPDGETGIRKTWIKFLQDVLADNPAIEAATDVHLDHAESHEWFSEENLSRNEPPGRAVWNRVRTEIAVDRHQGRVANYLYADGHVGAIAAEQVELWCDEGVNFALPAE